MAAQGGNGGNGADGHSIAVWCNGTFDVSRMTKTPSPGGTGQLSLPGGNRQPVLLRSVTSLSWYHQRPSGRFFGVCSIGRLSFHLLGEVEMVRWLFNAQIGCSMCVFGMLACGDDDAEPRPSLMCLKFHLHVLR